MILSTEITNRDKYIEAYRKEKEAWGLDNCMTPLTSAEERALWEECRSVINQASGLLGGAVTLDYRSSSSSSSMPAKSFSALVRPPSFSSSLNFMMLLSPQAIPRLTLTS